MMLCQRPTGRVRFRFQPRRLIKETLPPIEAVVEFIHGGSE